MWNRLRKISTFPYLSIKIQDLVCFIVPNLGNNRTVPCNSPIPMKIFRVLLLSVINFFTTLWRHDHSLGRHNHILWRQNHLLWCHNYFLWCHNHSLWRHNHLVHVHRNVLLSHQNLRNADLVAAVGKDNPLTAADVPLTAAPYSSRFANSRGTDLIALALLWLQGYRASMVRP